MPKALLVYYTYTGHTKIIAEKIKSKINCDVLELEPKEKYSEDYQYIVDMTENPTEKEFIEPEIKEINIDLSKYDTVIIGTPIWWYTMAPPVRSFLKKYDLSGKKVLAYATNAGWLGHTFKDIKELCPKLETNGELSIKFTEDYSENKILTPEKDIEKWMDKI